MKKNKILIYIFTILVLVGCDPIINVKNLNKSVQNSKDEVSKGTGCIDFEAPFVLGALYNSRRIIYTSPEKIQVSTHYFHSHNGKTFKNALITTPPEAFAKGQAIFINNINLTFDFKKVNFPVSKVVFQYLDLGGFENFSINNVHVYIGELNKSPLTIAGVNIQILPNSQLPQDISGTVVITGGIETIKIGGQELFIDDVCILH